MTRLDAPDSAIRFWAAMGLVALQSDDPWIVSALPKAAQEDAISVRITAANGLFNPGRDEAGRLAMIAGLEYPIIAARIRAACTLDTQPPVANDQLQPALKRAAAETDVRNLRGTPFGLNTPFQRAIQARTGKAIYYRWEPPQTGQRER